MGYVAWSVVYGEQPSAAKWNILGQNDASFNDGSGIANLGLNVTSLYNPYKFKVYRNAAQNATSSPSTLLCDTTIFDTSASVDITTNKGRFTAPVSGYYFFACRLRLLTNSNGFARANIYKNGSAAINGVIARSAGASTSVASVVSGIVSVSAGEYVEGYVDSDTTNAITVGNESENYFMGFLVSQT